LVLSSLSVAQDSPRSLLDRMSHSFRELNYQGSFSFEQGGSMQSLRIAHAVIDGEEYERLQYMDGDKREIIRRGHALNCVHPGHHLLRFYEQQQNLRFSPVNEAGIGEFYQFVLAGQGRVAGRDVDNLLISPKDSHRFGYRLSLDKESGLLLRTELIGRNNEVLERFQFADIIIGEPLDKAFFDGAEYSYHAEHIAPTEDKPVQIVAERSWQLKWLPRGFTPVVANRKVLNDDMATFTDGLTVFSVFLERNVDAQSLARGAEGSAQKGATTAYTRALLLANHPHRVTVVGEIPARTAQLIAQSVQLVEAESPEQ
jgi:sigma-E factor negative regulatory protein RseB